MRIEIKTEEESRIYLMGMISAFNKARVRFWGFGYDNDKTGREIRRFTCEEIDKLKEILNIESFSDGCFESVKGYAEELNKESK
jgi:hypothetical protein